MIGSACHLHRDESTSLIQRGGGWCAPSFAAAVKPFLNLAQARTPDGAELTLHSHDTEFYLRVNRQPLMGTNASESEKMLAQLACERLSTHAAPRVLIGGLGFGFTLCRVLELVGPGAIVQVAELLPEIVTWNREFLSSVNGLLLDDPRVTICIEDVYKIIAQTPAEYFDAILLDVDNGPEGLTRRANDSLYDLPGLARARAALRPGGVLAIWSSTPDKGFGMRLRKAGFDVAEIPVRSRNTHRGAHYVVWVAKPNPFHRPRI